MAPSQAPGMALTLGSACQVLGVYKSASLEEVRQAYRKTVLKSHPDKGGDTDHFCLVQKAFQLLKTDPTISANVDRKEARKRRGSHPDAAVASAHAVKRRRLVRVGSNGANSSEKQGSSAMSPTPSSTGRLATLGADITEASEPKRHLHPLPVTLPHLLGARRPRAEAFDPILRWRAEAEVLAAAAKGHAASSSTSSPLLAGPPINCGFTASRSPWPRPMSVSPIRRPAAPASRQHASMRRSPTSKLYSSAQRKIASQAQASAAASGALASALARHVRRESARAAGEDKPVVDRCPMLHRHLRAESKAREAAAAIASTYDIEAVAASIRKAPKEERRFMLEELPKATRAALEQHLVAQRAAASGTDAGSSCSTSAPSGGGDASSSTCGGGSTK